jgi:hypothetical protein
VFSTTTGERAARVENKQFISLFFPFFMLCSAHTGHREAAATARDKKKEEKKLLFFHLMDKTTPTINFLSLRD